MNGQYIVNARHSIVVEHIPLEQVQCNFIAGQRFETWHDKRTTTRWTEFRSTRKESGGEGVWKAPRWKSTCSPFHFGGHLHTCILPLLSWWQFRVVMIKYCQLNCSQLPVNTYILLTMRISQYYYQQFVAHNFESVIHSFNVGEEKKTFMCLYRRIGSRRQSRAQAAGLVTFSILNHITLRTRSSPQQFTCLCQSENGLKHIFAAYLDQCRLRVSDRLSNSRTQHRSRITQRSNLWFCRNLQLQIGR